MLIIQTVNEYHDYMRSKGANMNMMRMFNEETGETYNSGYVVSGYASEDSHKYFDSKAEAETFAQSCT